MLKNIDTVIVVMMENRSFDHVLGHMSLPAFAAGAEVDGLKNGKEGPLHGNPFHDERFYPFELANTRLESDLPHEREFIAEQLASDGTACKMDGFVEAYANMLGGAPPAEPAVMGYCTPKEVPISSFLARNYGVCDRWFAPLPASTQPNRLMALAGESHVDHSKGICPEAPPLILDWLHKRGVKWRVYHAGVSFFLLLGRFKDVLGPHFRDFSHLAKDFVTESDETFPEFIWIEPSFADAPHIGTDHPNDNHPPLPIGFGEQFLRDVYTAVTANPDRFGRTLLLITYDEHGGFYDHVAPLPIPYDPRPFGAYKPFSTSGVRVPTIAVSPFIEPGTVIRDTFDHTSILQLVAEKFGAEGESYSSRVAERGALGIKSASRVLNRDTPRSEIPKVPTEQIVVEVRLGESALPRSDAQMAFEKAGREFMKEGQAAAAKFPELWHALFRSPNR